MEKRCCCKKHQATDRLWSLLVMVYVLCRIVGDAGQPKMLELSAAATAKLNSLAADPRMEQLWKVISPGKKAAASGSSGSSATPHGVVPIDAALRAAVAKAMAVATAAQNAAAAAIAAMPGS